MQSLISHGGDLRGVKLNSIPIMLAAYVCFAHISTQESFGLQLTKASQYGRSFA